MTDWGVQPRVACVRRRVNAQAPNSQEWASYPTIFRRGVTWRRGRASVLVFDVNETLIDIEGLSPLFEQIFGDARAMREWFGQLVMYSMTTALSGCYVDFFTLGQGVLRMLGEIQGLRSLTGTWTASSKR